MESSRFIQLTSDILIEYIYTDQSNPTVFNTKDFGIEIMRDAYTSGSYFFNSANVANELGNYRDISAVSITENNTQYASLNTSIGVPYNDFDNNLTSTPQLPQTFSPDIDVEYDKIKIHFVAGFNFDDDFDGIIFEVISKRRDGINLNLSAISFLKTDTPVFNPDPFLIADKLYATYIEWRIPALYYLNNNFSKSNPNSVGYKLTQGIGFEATPSISISAKGIQSTILDNGFDFYNVREINTVSILNRDIYDNLFAQVIESTAGDYFELSGEVVGPDTFSDFIATLNSQGGDYVVFHEIVVSEQINTNFIKTSTQVFTQTTNFDNPILFRPIILNSSIAVSFAIDYTLRLFNRDDNTQIIKNARLTSYDPKKYGRRLNKINLGTVPTVAKVYNQISRDDGNQIVITDSANTTGQSAEDITNNLVVKTQFVTSFRDKINIKASISPVQIQNITETE